MKESQAPGFSGHKEQHITGESPMSGTVMWTAKGMIKTKYVIRITKGVENAHANKNCGHPRHKSLHRKRTSGHDHSGAVKHGQSDESSDTSEHHHSKE